MKYLKTMNFLDVLPKGPIYEAVLLYCRDPYKFLARDSNGIEGPTSTYNSDNNKIVNILRGCGYLGGAPEMSCTSSWSVLKRFDSLS